MTAFNYQQPTFGLFVCGKLKASGKHGITAQRSQRNQTRFGTKTYGLFRWSCLLPTICDQRTQFTGKMEILYGPPDGVYFIFMFI